MNPEQTESTYVRILELLDELNQRLPSNGRDLARDAVGFGKLSALRGMLEDARTVSESLSPDLPKQVPH